MLRPAYYSGAPLCQPGTSCRRKARGIQQAQAREQEQAQQVQWVQQVRKATLAGALALSLGIAIQNFPEGAIISMPLKAEGFSKSRSFLYGTLSGAVEPIGALLTILLAGILVPVLPYALSFAAGAMIYVVVEELIPEMSAGKHSNVGTILFAVGFTLMMVLDVALG